MIIYHHVLKFYLIYNSNNNIQICIYIGKPRKWWEDVIKNDVEEMGSDAG